MAASAPSSVYEISASATDRQPAANSFPPGSHTRISHADHMTDSDTIPVATHTGTGLEDRVSALSRPAAARSATGGMIPARKHHELRKTAMRPKRCIAAPLKTTELARNR